MQTLTKRTIKLRDQHQRRPRLRLRLIRIRIVHTRLLDRRGHDVRIGQHHDGAMPPQLRALSGSSYYVLKSVAGSPGLILPNATLVQFRHQANNVKKKRVSGVGGYPWGYLCFFFSKKYIHRNASRTQTYQPATARDFVFSHTHKARSIATAPHRESPAHYKGGDDGARSYTHKPPKTLVSFSVHPVKMCLPTLRDQMSSFGREQSIRDSASEITF